MSVAVTAPVPASPANGGGPSLAARLAKVHVGVRADLEVTRHLFRGEPAYVVRDPIALTCHRLGLAEYSILVHLDAERPLEAIFASLCARGVLDAAREEEFYAFVFSLHRLGFLFLPLHDEGLLYRRAQRKRSARARRWLGALFSCQLRLIDPDRFLSRTLPYVRPAFTRGALLVWTLTVGTAAWVVARNWGDFTAPLTNLFAYGNLPLLWAALILLKVAHELGHAYACKRFGGAVPGMGVTLTFLTPAAWVDASSSWSFPDRWKRFWVCMAGMYVELFLASLAVFVWAVTAPGLVHTLAHDMAVLASVVTLAFNLNPLLRFDGYHALCDLLEVPNLRARAAAYVAALAKRRLLGLPAPIEAVEPRLGVFFAAYVAGSALCRVTLVLALCVIVASRFHALGLFLAAAFVATALLRVAAKLAAWAWWSREAAAVRGRAVACSIFALALLPATLLGMPRPSHVLLPAVVGRTTERSVCAEHPGELVEIRVRPGDVVEADALLVRIDDPDAQSGLEAARARRRQAEIRARAAFEAGPGAAQAEEPRLRQADADLEAAELRERAQALVAPFPAGVVRARRDPGPRVERGEELLRLAAGPPRVRALCSQEDWSRCVPRVGDVIGFRSAADPGRILHGTIERVVARGEHDLARSLAPLTDAGGGDVALDPRTRHAHRAQFELVVALDAPHGADLPIGLTGVLRLDAPHERWAAELWRRSVLFVQRLRENG